MADADLKPIIQAIQIQASRDFSPLWNVDANLTLIGSGQKPDTRMAWVVISDHPEQASELGLADLNPRGQPLGHVYVQPARQYSSSLSVALSQEVLSLLAAPHSIELRVNQAKTMAYAVEVCTPVEPQRFGYSINDVLVSDFIYPAWFEDNSLGPWDQTQALTRPFQILHGGYSTQMDLTREPRAWVQQTASGHDATSRKLTGSRLDRRHRFRANGRRKFSQPL